MDLAPGWQIRCLKCGRTKPLGQTGAIRLGAWSKGKWTLAWCTKCRWLRIAAIERGDGRPADDRTDDEPDTRIEVRD